MKKALAILLSLLMVLSLCGCDAFQAQGETTVTDMVGRKVLINPGSYKKVVCIGAGALRMYSYVGDISLLSGVEDIDNLSLEQRPQMFDSVARPYMLAYADAFKHLPSCGVGGPMAQAAEAEKILACDPDIVISQFEDATKSDALQKQLGVPVITLSTGSDGVFDRKFSDCITLLGKVLGREEKAAALVSFVKQEKAAIEARVKTIPEGDKPGVYICGLGNWGTTNHLMTAENYISFRLTGVKNVVSGLGFEGIGPIEQEKFVDLGKDMDIIIMDAAAVKNIQPLYKEDKTMFATCKAWTEGQVYLQMAYNAYYTNYEIALINTWFIAKTVYPEYFSDVNMVLKTNEVTQAFLGADLAGQIFDCPSSFGGYQKIDTASFFE